MNKPSSTAKTTAATTATVRSYIEMVLIQSMITLACQKWNSTVWHVTINVHTACSNYTHRKRSQVRIETGGFNEGRAKSKGKAGKN